MNLFRQSSSEPATTTNRCISQPMNEATHQGSRGRAGERGGRIGRSVRAAGAVGRVGRDRDRRRRSAGFATMVRRCRWSADDAARGTGGGANFLARSIGNDFPFSRIIIVTDWPRPSP